MSGWSEGGPGQAPLPYPFYVDIVTKRYFDGVDNKNMQQVLDFVFHHARRHREDVGRQTDQPTRTAPRRRAATSQVRSRTATMATNRATAVCAAVSSPPPRMSWAPLWPRSSWSAPS